MRPESILLALGKAKQEYLELPEQGAARGAGRPVRRALLIAAVVVLLVTTAYGAVSGVRYLVKNVKKWSAEAPIRERKLDNNWYELYFEENPAAADAPETIAQYYLPKAPAGYRREHAVLSYGDAFETESGVVWVYGDPAAALDAAMDAWAAEHPSGMTQEELAAWEKEHPAPTVRVEEVSFSQKPLKALRDGNVFAVFGTLQPERLVKSGEIIDETEYVVYTYAPGEGEHRSGTETWYFWLDEARHYIFCMSFSEGIPQADRESFLRSVKPVEREAWITRCGLADWHENNEAVARENRVRTARGEELLPVNRFYLSDFAPAGYAGSSALVVGGESGALTYMQEWQDGKGRSASFYLGWTMDEDDFKDWDHDTRSLGGAEVDVWVRSFYEASDDSVWREEYWRWTAPDGETVLFLYFFNADNTEPEDEFRLSLFWSVREAEPEQTVR